MASRMLAWLLAAAMVFSGVTAGTAVRTAAAETAEAEETELQAAAETQAAGEELPVDLDLTKLSITMMIAELGNIIGDPEAYTGKRIRSAGQFTPMEVEGRNILYCYVGDPAGCCGQYLEFERAGEFAYPEDYPAPGSVIFLEGTFGTYEEDGVHYCRLEDAVLSDSAMQ